MHSSKCIHCKGRYPEQYCHRTFCPLHSKLYAFSKLTAELKSEEFFSSSRFPFVSRFNYPNLSVGILAPPGITDSSDYEAPRKWSQQNMDIPSILALRGTLVNSCFPSSIKQSSPQLELTQELAMAKKPVPIDVKLKGRPELRIMFSPDVAPIGPSAELRQLEITQNPRVHRAVERAVSDTELKATEAVKELSAKGIDEAQLTRLLSVGLLGRGTSRRLVPTRWSITAIDDTISKQHIARIRDFKHSNYLAFLGGYLGNHYLLLFIPGNFSYELFETFAGSTEFAHDYEGVGGRKEYAKNTAGGYYAARLAITEKLLNLKRQASVLAFRFISEEYSLPLGVWVVREAARKAASTNPIEFASLELMLHYAKLIAKKRFRTDLEQFLKSSQLIGMLRHQRTLTSFS